MNSATHPPVYIWDRFVRFTHWSVAFGFFANRFVLEDQWHEYVGYAIVSLIILRIFWGFVGSTYARFSHFLPSIPQSSQYAKSILSGKPTPYIGHTPLGTLMILSIWLGLIALGLTGWMQTLDAYWGDEWLEECHEWIANGVLLLVCIHIIAVVLLGKLEKRSLVKAMITGKK